VDQHAQDSSFIFGGTLKFELNKNSHNLGIIQADILSLSLYFNVIHLGNIVRIADVVRQTTTLLAMKLGLLMVDFTSLEGCLIVQ
jgi:hypothetical protein